MVRGGVGTRDLKSLLAGRSPLERRHEPKIVEEVKPQLFSVQVL